MEVNKRVCNFEQRYAVKVSDTTMMTKESNAGSKKEQHNLRFILLHSFPLGGLRGLGRPGC